MPTTYTKKNGQTVKYSYYVKKGRSTAPRPISKRQIIRDIKNLGADELTALHNFIVHIKAPEDQENEDQENEAPEDPQI